MFFNILFTWTSCRNFPGLIHHRISVSLNRNSI